MKRAHQQFEEVDDIINRYGTIKEEVCQMSSALNAIDEQMKEFTLLVEKNCESLGKVNNTLLSKIIDMENEKKRIKEEQFEEKMKRYEERLKGYHQSEYSEHSEKSTQTEEKEEEKPINLTVVTQDSTECFLQNKTINSIGKVDESVL